MRSSTHTSSLPPLKCAECSKGSPSSRAYSQKQPPNQQTKAINREGSSPRETAYNIYVCIYTRASHSSQLWGQDTQAHTGETLTYARLSDHGYHCGKFPGGCAYILCLLSACSSGPGPAAMSDMTLRCCCGAALGAAIAGFCCPGNCCGRAGCVGVMAYAPPSLIPCCM